jgi:hypothetical protein
MYKVEEGNREAARRSILGVVWGGPCRDVQLAASGYLDHTEPLLKEVSGEIAACVVWVDEEGERDDGVAVSKLALVLI